MKINMSMSMSAIELAANKLLETSLEENFELKSSELKNFSEEKLEVFGKTSTKAVVNPDGSYDAQFSLDIDEPFMIKVVETTIKIMNRLQPVYQAAKALVNMVKAICPDVRKDIQDFEDALIIEDHYEVLNLVREEGLVKLVHVTSFKNGYVRNNVVDFKENTKLDRAFTVLWSGKNRKEAEDFFELFTR